MTGPDAPPSRTSEPDEVRIDLPLDQHAPAQARRVAREALAAWRLPELVDTVVLAVSELVTNAVRYGRPSVSLQLLRRTRHLRVAVHDGEPTEPRGVGTRPSSPDAESGRGLTIVQALAGEVAVEHIDDDGKVVRVDIAVPSPAQE